MSPPFGIIYDPMEVSLSIYIDGKFKAGIELEKLTDSASVLYYLTQLSRTDWCTDEMLGAFIRGLNKAFLKHHGRDTQDVVCRDNSNHHIRPGAWRRKATSPSALGL